MQRTIENVRFFRESLKSFKCRKSDEGRKFELIIALNVTEKFLLEDKIFEASFALMKYDASAKELASFVSNSKKAEVLARHKEITLWFLEQDIFKKQYITRKPEDEVRPNRCRKSHRNSLSSLKIFWASECRCLEKVADSQD
ncbi:hypothetical protein D1R32_gp085 [Tunisvirus fontaine2]|uniref:Uncharacterized protein n=1 Tax=Tunisvirus fontaine2 TaxID=1421067 RepID=V9SGB9_9VIRU|nr:hypothetical protein D1R32_gp085 [Tunisvirus fontaine2]AHC54802.1 hypothetical protein TNS_ORF84 [Tunisvirus fontaine2]